jgi:hypothetical protein
MNNSWCGRALHSALVHRNYFLISFTSAILCRVFEEAVFYATFDYRRRGIYWLTSV